jgi:hypothetical protein
MNGKIYKNKYFFFFFVSIIISGCKIDITSDIYTRDIFSDKNLTFPSQLRIEIPSCSKEKIDESSPEILALFAAESAPNISGCESEGMNSMLTVNFTGEIADSESNYDFAIFRNRSKKEEGVITLSPAFNPIFRQRIDQLMSSKRTSLDYDDLTINFTLNNDLSSEVIYFVVSGWVDGKPGQEIFGSLQRREKIYVTLPDVFSHLALNDEQPELIGVYIKED